MKKVLMMLSLAAFLFTTNSALSRSWTDFTQARIRYTLNGNYQSESMAKNAALASIQNLRQGILPAKGHIWARAKWGRDKCKSYWSSVDRKALYRYVQRRPGKVKVQGFTINGPRYDRNGVRSYSATVRAEFPCIKTNNDDDDDDGKRNGKRYKDDDGKKKKWKDKKRKDRKKDKYKKKKHRDKKKGKKWKDKRNKDKKGKKGKKGKKDGRKKGDRKGRN